MKRRSLLKLFSAASLAPGATLPGLGFAAGNSEARLVVVLLRGGMDGLAVVPPVGDPDHERARAGAATVDPLHLDGDFGLTAELTELHALYGRGQCLVVHAVASPYRARSHFDAQHLLENGTAMPFGTPTGWLNRTLLAVPGSSPGIAIGNALPVIMRGDVPVSSWSPSVLPEPDTTTIDRVERLYREHPAFSSAFAQAQIANDRTEGMAVSRARGGQFPTLMGAAGRFLADPDGPRVAYIELGGWDSHVSQNAEYGTLRRSLRSLDQGIASLKASLGPSWEKTAVVAITEFGRTVAMNGSNGTDHGTASCAVLCGGAVAGGRVVADWPGLRARDLFEGRDLRPTTDLRSIFKTLLLAHLGLPEDHVESVVFPASADVRPLPSLITSNATLT